MKDAALDLLEALRGALVGNADVAALVGTRVASSWGVQLSPPFIRLRARSSVPFEADSSSGPEVGAETTITVHCFTKEHAPVILYDLAAKVREALEGADTLALDDADLWTLEWVTTAYPPDTDSPNVQMAVLTFRAQSTA